MNWLLRVAQWIIAIHYAKTRVPWFGMIRALLSGPVPRSVWRSRMRYGCYQCPLFNKERMTCRGVFPPYDKHGCDCYVVFSALTAEPYAGGCYGRAKFGGDFGWGAYVFPSRTSRLLAPFRFLMGR